MDMPHAWTFSASLQSLQQYELKGMGSFPEFILATAKSFKPPIISPLYCATADLVAFSNDLLLKA